MLKSFKYTLTIKFEIMSNEWWHIDRTSPPTLLHNWTGLNCTGPVPQVSYIFSKYYLDI